MNPDLQDEIGSVNAIYDAEILCTGESSDSIVILDVPGASVRLRISVPADYPNRQPSIEGPETSGADLKRGEASSFADRARKTLASVFRQGEPCMFDLVEELKETGAHDEEVASAEISHHHVEESTVAAVAEPDVLPNAEAPDWTLSDVVTEKKSVFVARAVSVNEPSLAKAYIEHLLATDKKAAKATHNMTAWRMKDEQTGVTYRDCDDDGETAAGSRLLHLLELMDVWNVLVVVSRWYGGVHLGPDRFRIINSVARDAIVKEGISNESSKSRR